MRARTITTMFLLVCALAIPTGASGHTGSVADSISGGASDSSQPLTTPDHSALDASLNGLATFPSDPSGIARRTVVPGSASSGDAFDWADAALGAGAAMAFLALGAAALFSVRRRSAMSPSASTS